MDDHNGFPYPGPDATDAPRLLVPASVTLVIALALYVPRMYTRIRPVNSLGWDDYTVSLAMLLGTASTIFGGISCYYGVGRRSYYVDYESGKLANHWSFASQPLCVWAICFAKCSVAFMLVRVKRTPGWRVFLYIAIAIQIISAAAANIAQMIQCNPVEALWDSKIFMLPTTKCWAPKHIQISAYVNAAISITTDIVFSLLPISFLRKMNRPLRERFVLGFLMALGLLATLASILKLTLIFRYRTTKDPYWDVIPLSLWWQLEQNISIIASCIPTLKSPFERVLRRTGLLSTTTGLSRSTKGYVAYGGNSGLQLGSLKTTVEVGNVREINDDAKSEDSILRTERAAYMSPRAGISKTTELHSSTEQLDVDAEWESAKRNVDHGHNRYKSWVG